MALHTCCLRALTFTNELLCCRMCTGTGYGVVTYTSMFCTMAERGYVPSGIGGKVALMCCTDSCAPTNKRTHTPETTRFVTLRRSRRARTHSPRLLTEAQDALQAYLQ